MKFVKGLWNLIMMGLAIAGGSILVLWLAAFAKAVAQ